MKNQGRLKEAVIANVKKYPLNIKRALTLAASQTGCSYNQAHNLWYGRTITLKNGKTRCTGLRAQEPYFMIATKDGIAFNSKVAHATKVGPRSLHLNKEVVSLGNIPTEDKVAFFDMIFK